MHRGVRGRDGKQHAPRERKKRDRSATGREAVSSRRCSRRGREPRHCCARLWTACRRTSRCSTRRERSSPSTKLGGPSRPLSGIRREGSRDRDELPDRVRDRVRPFRPTQRRPRRPCAPSSRAEAVRVPDGVPVHRVRMGRAGFSCGSRGPIGPRTDESSIAHEDITEVKQAQDALARLTARLMKVQDEERRAIARELHDTTAQNLLAATLNVTRLRDRFRNIEEPARLLLTETLELIEQSLQEVRTLSYVLHPPLLDVIGLPFGPAVACPKGSRNEAASRSRRTSTTSASRCRRRPRRPCFVSPRKRWPTCTATPAAPGPASRSIAADAKSVSRFWIADTGSRVPSRTRGMKPSRASGSASRGCAFASSSSEGGSTSNPDVPERASPLSCRSAVARGPRPPRPNRPIATMLRILLADDHDIVRRGLKELLEEHVGWSVCAEASDGRAAVELALAHRPQIAVLDLSMPELNGLEATRRIRERLPDTEVLIFSMHESEELIRDVLAAGARGYLLKSDASRQLVPAVESLARHKPFFSGRVSEVVLSGFLKAGQAQAGPSALERLTSREREVVQLLAGGQDQQADREAARSERQDGRDASILGNAQAQPEVPARSRPIRDTQSGHSALKAGRPGRGSRAQGRGRICARATRAAAGPPGPAEACRGAVASTPRECGHPPVPRTHRRGRDRCRNRRCLQPSGSRGAGPRRAP